MRVMNTIFAAVFLINLIYYSNSQSSCITPNGENGNCILFVTCEPFIKIWDNRTSKNIAFFRNSHCGYSEKKPLVCCGSVAEYMNTTPSVPITTKPAITEKTIAKTTEEQKITTISSSSTSPPISSSSPQLFTSIILSNTPTTSTISPNVPFTSSAISTSPSTVLFTSSGVSTSSPSTTTSAVSDGFQTALTGTPASGYESHPNFDLLPPPGRCGLQTTARRISNGNETDLDEYPWMAMLLYRDDEGKLVPNCGGSLINSRYVMTAAHCIKGNLYSVRLGEYNISSEIDCIIEEGDEVCADPPQEFKVEDWIIFKRYSNRNVNRHHDIALIRLQGEANITDFVKPICLPLNNERSDPGDVLSVAGWGLTEKNITSEVKLVVDLPMWTDSSCRELYSIGYGINITSRQFCAGGGAFGKDSCGGDSGGPLMRTFKNRTEYYVEGIVSFGPDPCGRQATPGVYVRVTNYVKWILNNIKR